jgi:hypothetical protein
MTNTWGIPPTKFDFYRARDALSCDAAGDVVEAYRGIRRALVALDTMPASAMQALAGRIEVALLKYPDDLGHAQRLQNDVLRAYHALLDEMLHIQGR